MEIDSNPDIGSIIKRVVVAADSYVRRVEYANDLIENGSGHLSTQDEADIAAVDGERLQELVAAVMEYRKYKK